MSAAELGEKMCRSWQHVKQEQSDGGAGACIGEMADDFSTIARLILAKNDPKQAKAALIDNPPVAMALINPCLEPTAIVDAGAAKLDPDPYVDAGSRPAVQQ
jgi:hypothetical protein